jgi:sigma-B regulation protein RsbU (phosphoserine phosphatase)
VEAGGTMRELGPGLRLRAARLAPGGIRSVDDAPLETADREALEAAGVGWLLAVGHEPVRAVLLLGHRLAGGWLSPREILELGRFADHLAVTLENAALRIEARSRGVLERELKEAGDIQAHLLPRQAPVYPTLDCAAAALSSESVGGDYYDFVHGPGREFTLVVGDAAGKGVPAALLLAQVQARFRGQSRRGLSPAQLLGVLNQDLVGLDQPEKFVGLLCARVDVRAGCIWFANAGLTPPLVRRHDGQFFEVLAGGVLLGVSSQASYADTCVELGAGDLVLIYTDGLTEARRGEELFGVERVQAVLEGSAHRRAADVVEELLREVRAFTDRPLDDLTVLVLKQLTDPAEAPHEGSQERLKVDAQPADTSI